MIALTIDGKEVTVQPGTTILAAAREGGIDIPTLCYHESLLPIGSCRLCLVEVEGYSEPMTACTTPALDGIVVTTRSERLFRMRREISAAHPRLPPPGLSPVRQGRGMPSPGPRL